MKNTNTIVIISSVLVVAAIAGVITFSPARSTGMSTAAPVVNVDLTRAELELATINKNLDSIFLSIKKLDILGEATQEELATLKEISNKLEVQNSQPTQTTDGWSSFEKNIKQKSIAQARAELELANIKQDFEAMFIAIRKLESLGVASSDELAKLGKVVKVIKLTTSLEQAKADHNHEAVVQNAGKILDIFPTHADTRRALKESGLIFFYLSQGIEEIKKIPGYTDKYKVAEDASYKATLIAMKKRNDDTSRSINLAQGFFNKASKLDPFFVDSLEIMNNIESLKTIRGNAIAQFLCGEYDDIYEIMETRGVESVNTFRRAIVDWKREPFDGDNSAWSLVEDDNKRIARISGEYTRILLAMVNATKDYKTEDNEELLALTERLIKDLPTLNRELLNTKGNSLTGWRTSFRAAQNRWANSNSDYNAASGNISTDKDNMINAVKAWASLNLFKSPGKTKPVLEKHKEVIRDL